MAIAGRFRPVLVRRAGWVRGKSVAAVAEAPAKTKERGAAASGLPLDTLTSFEPLVSGHAGAAHRTLCSIRSRYVPAGKTTS